MNLNSTKLNYKKETTCTKFRGGKFSKVHQRFLKLHVPSILCILDFLEKDRILHLMKIHGVNFVEKFIETRSKKFQNCCNEFLERKKEKKKYLNLEREKSSNSNRIHVLSI